MDTIYKYRIVTQESIPKLVDDVNNSLENGWELQGGLVSLTGELKVGTRYAQAMRRERFQQNIETKVTTLENTKVMLDEANLESVINRKKSLSPKEREWCKEQVVATESYSDADTQGLDDQSLARLVIHCWTEYCRDKGLL